MEAEKPHPPEQQLCSSSSLIDGSQELGKQQLISPSNLEVVNEENITELQKPKPVIPIEASLLEIKEEYCRVHNYDPTHFDSSGADSPKEIPFYREFWFYRVALSIAMIPGYSLGLIHPIFAVLILLYCCLMPQPKVLVQRSIFPLISPGKRKVEKRIFRGEVVHITRDVNDKLEVVTKIILYNNENDHLYFFASLSEPETLPLQVGNYAQIEGKGKIVTITNENMFVKTGNSNRKKIHGKNCEWEGVESIMVLQV